MHGIVQGPLADSEQPPEYPEIIEDAPSQGDVHPLDSEDLAYLLAVLPPAFTAGLKRIHLRPRKCTRIGEPFGCYWRDEHTIILHSLPATWRLDRAGADFLRGVTAFDGEIDETDEGFVITWPEPGSMALWFYANVLAHELAHHYIEHQRTEGAPPADIDHLELAKSLTGQGRLTIMGIRFADKYSRPAPQRA